MRVRRELQSAAVATGVGKSIEIEGKPATLFQVSGTFVGTITFQGRIDTDWTAIVATNLSDGTTQTTATAAGLYLAPSAGLMEMRANITAWTSGTITVTAHVVDKAPGLAADVQVSGSVAVTSIATGDNNIGNVDLASAIPAGANNIGDVDILTIAAGETHIGEVGSPGITISQIPTVTNGAYSAGDAVGGLLTFANAARVSGGGGVVKSVIIIDDAGQDVELELWLFDRTFTPITDNAAWAPLEADLENLVAVISTEDSAQGWLAAGTPSAIDIGVSKRFDLDGTSLFGQLVTRGTPTFAATDDVTVKVGLLQD